MIIIIHFEEIGFIISTAIMWIGRIAIKKRALIIVQANYLVGRPAFNLNAEQPIRDFGKVSNTTEPS